MLGVTANLNVRLLGIRASLNGAQRWASLRSAQPTELCHSLTPNAEVDFSHLSSVFAAIANMIDMAQSASDHAHMQLQRERVKPKSKPL
ncbi:hypothetical protein DVJ77_04515 [Dyella tabacisoli]|uniref:Uncharacterized protein n=2 Tax=Dyella tabacisoli TaxID=2282381 RepID=A0A369UQ63_9GAMM|nr:hypothetical protein DVJ77_04515 [Dyella tabacisoli]